MALYRHEGKYCRQDLEGKRHHRLKTHYLKALIKYVEQGGVLETHDDVPDSVREQLYAEGNQRLDKKKKAADNSTTGSMCPPININNFPSSWIILAVDAYPFGKWSYAC